MKTTTLKTAIMACIIVLGMTNCSNTPKDKAIIVENEKKNLNNAEQDLEQAVLDSTNEYTLYKIQMQEKLTANELKIADLKAEMKAEKAELRQKYEKQLVEIEIKNLKLKNSVADYKENDKNNWENFKASFNRDIDSLGQAISRITLKD